MIPARKCISSGEKAQAILQCCPGLAKQERSSKAALEGLEQRSMESSCPCTFVSSLSHLPLPIALLPFPAVGANLYYAAKTGSNSCETFSIPHGGEIVSYVSDSSLPCRLSHQLYTSGVSQPAAGSRSLCVRSCTSRRASVETKSAPNFGRCATSAAHHACGLSRDLQPI